MKILQYRDCEVTSPPSTGFVFLPECESDCAFVAELVDLPTCNRVKEVMVTDSERIREVVEAGITPRISVQSLFAHLQDSPASNENYANEVIGACARAFVCESDTLLKKGFWIRTFWF